MLFPVGKRSARAFLTSSVVLVSVLLLAADTWYPRATADRASWLSASRQFDFTGWTLNALGFKLAQATLGQQGYASAGTRKAVVDEYLTLEDQADEVSAEIEKAFANPAEANPLAATQGARARLGQLRQRQGELEAMVEGILEEQVAAALDREGFAVEGQVLPPVSFHFSPVPLVLILSPRSVIREEASIQLDPHLLLEEQVALESAVEERLGVSALVVPLGGIGTYPTMIEETSSLNWIVQVIAHEWTHNYLALRPLGWNYDSSPQMRTINETVAELVGQSIGEQVIETQYPERRPPAPPPPAPAAPPAQPPAFDFQAAMHETRVNTDRLLAEGQVQAAQEYMEARRQVFVAHGYNLRRINQAYFAFYGAYAEQPGERGEDPVGPAVQRLRERSATIGEFLRTAARITSFDQLLALVGPG